MKKIFKYLLIGSFIVRIYSIYVLYTEIGELTPLIPVFGLSMLRIGFYLILYRLIFKRRLFLYRLFNIVQKISSLVFVGGIIYLVLNDNNYKSTKYIQDTFLIPAFIVIIVSSILLNITKKSLVKNYKSRSNLSHRHQNQMNDLLRQQQMMIDSNNFSQQQLRDMDLQIQQMQRLHMEEIQRFDQQMHQQMHQDLNQMHNDMHQQMHNDFHNNFHNF